MKGLISEKLISKLKPAEKPYEVRDTRLPGFILRVQPYRWYHPDGSPCLARMECSLEHRPPVAAMSFIAQYARGKRYTIAPTAKLSAEKARKEAALRIADAVKGLDPMAERRRAKSYSFREYIEQEYQPYLSTNFRESHAKEAIRQMRALFPILQDKKLSEIDSFAIEKYRSGRLRAGVSAATTNREISTLKAAFNVAMAKGLLKSNHIAKVKKLKEDSDERVRYLAPEERTRLYETLDKREAKMRAERENSNAWRRQRGYTLLPEYGTYTDHLKPMTLLDLNTGLRRGELFNLQWEHIDLARRSLAVYGRTAKSRKTRRIPLNDEANEVITAWQKQTSCEGLVFPNTDGKRMGSIKTAWAHLIRDAKIKDFRFHDCRHDFASQLVMKGVDLFTVSKLLGHSSIEVTMRYAHLAPSHMSEAVAKLVVVP